VRTFGVLAVVGSLLGAVIGAGWFMLAHASPGSIGTPSHAGVVSQGRLQDCTNVNLAVGPRSYEKYFVVLDQKQQLRAAVEAHGGFGRVDVMLRIIDPQGSEIHVSPRFTSYTVTVPAQVRGEYAFVFDNRYSIFTAKSVAFYYCVDRSREPGDTP
jgi:hypothetical protein